MNLIILVRSANSYGTVVEWEVMTSAEHQTLSQEVKDTVVYQH